MNIPANVTNAKYFPTFNKEMAFLQAKVGKGTFDNHILSHFTYFSNKRTKKLDKQN